MASGDPSAAALGTPRSTLNPLVDATLFIPQVVAHRRYGDGVNAETFVSYGQNGEDVVLMRALGHLSTGRYVEVGANDPTIYSITRGFYDRGWSGITIEPMHDFAERHRSERPRDILIEAAISADPSGSVVLHQIAETGLSTLIDSVGEVHRESGWSVTDVTVPARRLDDVLGLAGWVRNEPDGTVYGEAEGPETVLEVFQARLAQGPPFASVSRLDWSPPDMRSSLPRPFEIRR